jgi:SNF2 family DNA or RNA helicase
VAADWFGGADRARPFGSPALPSAAGIRVGDAQVELTAAGADDLRERVERAIGAGEPAVELAGPEGAITVPATHDTLGALAHLAAARDRPSKRERPTEHTEAEVLLIYPNEQTLEDEALVFRRPAPAPGPPAALATPPKGHQSEGLDWLQKAWAEGLPGVLLADDMGLGKTLQGLAFVAWLRWGMAEGIIPSEPVLVVAPIGILATWQKEHADHLAAPGLGECVAAYGQGLRALRHLDASGRPAVNIAALRRSDWVLTTYETLRDYDRDFGQVRFAAAIFDETQKIKTPGIRLTDAAKGMNAGFRIAMTGTPVENRLSDLWCIIDGVSPGCLGDLKAFSLEYEKDQDPQRLKRLRATLDGPVGGRPPVMLRRLRHERLPDLPRLNQKVDERIMPAAQVGAYTAAIERARAGGRGDVLAALQRLRAVSLHPEPAAAVDDDEFISASARFAAAFDALDEIEAKRERALLFVDDLAIQARLRGLIQRRYRLAATPMAINGTVAGSSRQGRVERFQSAPSGFDVMILSPRAGGVGLTLTRANHVIHLSRWWNPAVEDQCNGRALRIGQTRSVTVHIPVAVLPSHGRSFDQNLHALLKRKRQLMYESLLPPEATESERQLLLEDSLAGAST